MQTIWVGPVQIGNQAQDICEIPTETSGTLLRAIPYEVFQEYIFLYLKPRFLIKLQYVCPEFLDIIQDNITWMLIMKQKWFQPALKKLEGFLSKWPTCKERFFNLKFIRQQICDLIRHTSKGTRGVLMLAKNQCMQEDVIGAIEALKVKYTHEGRVSLHGNISYFPVRFRKGKYCQEKIETCWSKQIEFKMLSSGDKIISEHTEKNGVIVPHGKGTIEWKGRITVSDGKAFFERDNGRKVRLRGEKPDKIQITQNRSLMAEVSFHEGVIIDEDLQYPKFDLAILWEPCFSDFE